MNTTDFTVAHFILTSAYFGFNIVLASACLHGILNDGLNSWRNIFQLISSTILNAFVVKIALVKSFWRR